MKINGIDARLGTSSYFKKTSNTKNSPQVAKNSNSIGLSNFYDTSFTGSFEIANRKKFDKTTKEFTPAANQMFKHAQYIATKLNSPQITGKHLFLASLSDVKKYMDDLDNGAIKHDENSTFETPATIEALVGMEGLFADKKNRDKIRPVIQKYATATRENIKSESALHQSKFVRKPKISDALIADINSSYEIARDEAEAVAFADNIFLASLLNTRNREILKTTRNFITDLQEAVMIDDKPAKQKIHLQFYDEKADKLWKNLDLGNDIFVTYDGDNKAAAKHLLSSFTNLIKKPGQKYSKLNEENTDVTVFKSNANFDLIQKKYEQAIKDKSKTHVFVVDFSGALTATALARGYQTTMVDSQDIKMLKNRTPDGSKTNVRFVFVANQNTYYANTAQGSGLKDALNDFGMLSIPMVNAQKAKEILSGDSGKKFITDMTGKNFESDAITRSIDITSTYDGYYPEKALKFMKNASSFYIDKDIITLDDIKTYEKEIRDVQKTAESNNEFNIIFETGKTLDDIKGSPMTRAEAQSLVNHITRKPKGGTRGYTTFLDNGTSYGGGRRHTAECIAGQAGVPMVIINAKDFALKDIDALSQNSNLSELKIKKLISTAKAQAEANSNRTAMIYIENFDNFGSNPLYGISSIYEQKAFSQLLSEMENIRKNDNINLIVVGSMNMPDLLDENIMKPYKFLDTIIIYSPKDNKDRIDILNYYIEKQGLKISGSTPEERAKIIQSVAETTNYFSVVDLMHLLEKADEVSHERGKNAIDRSDFTEAYLQSTSGRVSSSHRSKHSDEIVTAHECGHALNLQIMYNIASKENKPWHLPDQPNFIALDPRGDYLGAMYPKDSDNEEYSFEKVFSELVCDFGGHGSEKYFYNMDGSWGITQDMAMATSTAKTAVWKMGMGHNTGKMTLNVNEAGIVNASQRVKDNADKDVEVFLKNAQIVSSKIIETYSGFIDEFTQKYKDKVGTGDCLIMAEEFNQELNEWKSKQSKEKQEELDALEKEILQIIDKTKKGETVEEQ